MAEKFILKWSDDPLEQIKFALDFQSIMRYKYADSMLKARDKENLS